MFKPKELGKILLVIIILGFTISFKHLFTDSINYPNKLGIALISIAIIIFINLIAKKLTAYYYETDTEINIWNIQRYWIKEHHHFKKPVPAGIIFPFILTIISYGSFYWLACLEFAAKPLKARASKRHGYYSYSEMTEWHFALIAASGIIINLIAAVIAYFIGFPEFARLSVYYTAFNILPIGNLDGAKTFFGSRILWTTLVIICAIFLGYAWLMP